MHAQLQFIFTVILLVSLAACGEGPGSRQQTAEPGITAPYIVAVNNPLRYFSARLLGDLVDVRLLAPAGQDPALWQPTVDDILQLQQAELIILNGAGYSGWPDTTSISARKLVDSSAGLQDRLIKLEQQTTHSHGPEGEHVVPGETGEFAEPDPSALAAAVARVLQRREAYSRAALQYAHGNLPVEHMLDGLEAAIACAAARH